MRGEPRQLHSDSRRSGERRIVVCGMGCSNALASDRARGNIAGWTLNDRHAKRFHPTIHERRWRHHSWHVRPACNDKWRCRLVEQRGRVVGEPLPAWAAFRAWCLRKASHHHPRLRRTSRLSWEKCLRGTTVLNPDHWLQRELPRVPLNLRLGTPLARSNREAQRDWLSPPDRFGPPYVRLKRSARLSLPEDRFLPAGFRPLGPGLGVREFRKLNRPPRATGKHVFAARTPTV